MINNHMSNKQALIQQQINKQKRIDLYNSNPYRCVACNSIFTYECRKLKFCNHSCSASYINSNKPNNKRKHPKKNCPVCNTITTNAKYCSKKCGGIGKTSGTLEERAHKRKMLGREYTARYSAKKKNQTPSNADLKAIKEFYLNCPVGHEVDHIMPISRGGLHSLENLQYLTISENRKKWCKIMEPPERFELP